MRVTLKDIAKDTGYSVTTVSLILNNKASNISEKARETILASSKRLGYRPNQVAVSLVKKRTNTAGLIISDVSNQFFASIAKGAEDLFHQKGWNMILCNTNDSHGRDLEYINILADKAVDGIIYGMSSDSSLELAQESISTMQNLGMPFVMVDRYFHSMNYPVVAVDHQYGGYIATKHLLEIGRRRIACITGPMHLEDSTDRLNGYRKALGEAGIPFDGDIIYEGRYTMESGEEALQSLLGKDFDAIFTFNDMTAYGVYTCLRNNSLSVPDDVALVGYDNLFFSRITRVPLTTIHQPTYEMGWESAKRLLHLIDGSYEDGRSDMFKPHLVVRESTNG